MYFNREPSSSKNILSSNKKVKSKDVRIIEEENMSRKKHYKSNRRHNRSIKSIKVSKYSIDKVDEVNNKREITLAELIRNIKDMSVRYNEDFSYLLDGIQNNEITPSEAIGQLIDFQRGKDINSNMVMMKLGFVVACLALEVVLVRILNLEDMKGLSQYMCSKMANFIEFFHFVASERVETEGTIEKNSGYYMNKLIQSLALEFVMFIAGSMCVKLSIVNKETLEKISNMTINDVNVSRSDGMMGYFANVVAGLFTGATTSNNNPEADL